MIGRYSKRGLLAEDYPLEAANFLTKRKSNNLKGGFDKQLNFSSIHSKSFEAKQKVKSRYTSKNSHLSLETPLRKS